MGIAIREADLDRELGLLAATVNDAFQMTISMERFRWLYLDNPDGRAVAWFAVDDTTGDIAGCTAVSPRRINVDGREFRAWNCGDFSIGARYRTMGAAIKLRRAARDAVDAGVSPFLYAHPNDRMLQVHLRVGHTPLARMQRFAKPLRLTTNHPLLNRVGSPLLRLHGRELLVRRAGEVELLPQGPLPADIDAVFDGARGRRGTRGTMVIRDRRYLDWRFGAYPEQKTETLIVRHGGRPAAYLTFVLSGQTASVKDWLAIDDRARDQVFVALIRRARQSGATSATFTALETHPDLPGLRGLGFVPRAETSTVVTYASHAHPIRASVTDPSRWYMTSGDRDV